MNKLLTPQYILKAFDITTKINVVAFIAAVLLSVGWTYLLFGFWDWEHLMYLCLFYGVNLGATLLLKRWYENHLEQKRQLSLPSKAQYEL